MENNSSSYATITPQYLHQGLQTQVDQLGGDVPYLIPTKQQTILRTMHSKQCDNNFQMDGDSEDRRSILGMSICYARWTWTRQGIFTKRHG